MNAPRSTLNTAAGPQPKLPAVLLAAMILAWPAGALPADPEARQITWEDLLPEGWVPPSAEVDHFFDAAPTQTTSSAEAPVVDALDSIRVKLPGYLVPITLDGQKIKDFLMVPYFGACIHVPPPPPNQVVFVQLDEAIEVDDPYGAHWVTGVLSTAGSNTDLAEAAYTMRGERVDVFDWDAMYGDSGN